MRVQVREAETETVKVCLEQQLSEVAWGSVDVLKQLLYASRYHAEATTSLLARARCARPRCVSHAAWTRPTRIAMGAWNTRRRRVQDASRGEEG